MVQIEYLLKQAIFVILYIIEVKNQSILAVIFKVITDTTQLLFQFIINLYFLLKLKFYIEIKTAAGCLT